MLPSEYPGAPLHSQGLANHAASFVLRLHPDPELPCRRRTFVAAARAPAGGHAGTHAAGGADGERRQRHPVGRAQFRPRSPSGWRPTRTHARRASAIGARTGAESTSPRGSVASTSCIAWTRRPEREEVLYSMDVGGGEFFQLFLFDPATGGSRRLTDGTSRNVQPAWSRDGRALAYSSTRRDRRCASRRRSAVCRRPGWPCRRRTTWRRCSGRRSGSRCGGFELPDTVGRSASPSTGSDGGLILRQTPRPDRRVGDPPPRLH